MLTLANAQAIITHTLEHAHVNKFKPLGVVVIDARGAVIASAAEDGSSIKRFQIAHAKAQGSLSFNMNSSALEKLAIDCTHSLSVSLAFYSLFQLRHRHKSRLIKSAAN